MSDSSKQVQEPVTRPPSPAEATELEPADIVRMVRLAEKEKRLKAEIRAAQAELQLTQLEIQGTSKYLEQKYQCPAQLMNTGTGKITRIPAALGLTPEQQRDALGLRGAVLTREQAEALGLPVDPPKEPSQP